MLHACGIIYDGVNNVNKIDVKIEHYFDSNLYNCNCFYFSI